MPIPKFQQEFPLMAAMGDMPDISWKIVPVRPGHYDIPEMNISKPKIVDLNLKSSQLFQD